MHSDGLDRISRAARFVGASNSHRFDVGREVCTQRAGFVAWLVAAEPGVAYRGSTFGEFVLREAGVAAGLGQRVWVDHGEVRFARARVLPEHVGVSDAQALGLPIHVAPAQPQQLGAAQAAQRCGQQPTRAGPARARRRGRRCGASSSPMKRERAPRLVRDRTQDCLELTHGENCRSGFAPLARCRQGLVARCTGLSFVQPRSVACSNTPCRKTSTLWTLFGLRPCARIADAIPSTSAVLTFVNDLVPRRGSMHLLR